MNILFVRWDVIMLWKLLSGTPGFTLRSCSSSAAMPSILLHACSWVLAIYARSPALMRAERRVANIRQIVLLLLLLFGITAANEVFGVFCRVRVVQSSFGDLDVISACGPRAAFAF
jgi:hypothetical protein